MMSRIGVILCGISLIGGGGVRGVGAALGHVWIDYLLIVIGSVGLMRLYDGEAE